MKKLFVLFLLVALVPFTVGCSLWGSDDDNAVYTPGFVTSKVVVPAAGLNLRAAVSNNFSLYTLTLNSGLTLRYVSHVTVGGNVEITFSGEATSAQLAALGTGTVMAVLNNGIENKAPIYFPAGSGEIKVTVAVDGTVSVTVGGTPVVVADETDTIKSVMNGELAITSAVPTTAVTVTAGKINFVIEANKEFEVVASPKNYAYSVLVGTTAVADANFALTQTPEQLAAKKATIAIDAAGRTPGEIYTVTINYIIVDGIKVGATTFKFKMPAA